MEILWKKYNKTEKFLFVFSIVFFLISFISLFVFIKTHFVYYIDSDDASELILSKILADEKRLITDNWYYSTELHVLNTQILYSFFFNITQNWCHVRLLSFGCLYVIMFLSLLFMMDRLNIKKYFFVVAGILCIPFSSDYFNFVLKGAYYLPHITIPFLAIGIIEWISDSQKRQRTFKTIAIICISFLLAMVAGLGGARQVVITYLPLFFSGLFIFIQKTVSIVESDSKQRQMSFSLGKLSGSNARFIIASIVSCIGSVIGYYINVVILSKIFSFYQFNISFSDFDIYKLSQTVAGFLNTLGFTSYSVFSHAMIYNIVCFACITAVLFSFIYGVKQKNDEKLYRYTVICLASVLVFSLLYLFSDTPYTNRYNLQIIVLFVPLFAFALSQCSCDWKYKIQISIFLVFLLALRGVTFYMVEHKTDKTSELRIISKKLINNNYFNGYATFWNANILTELTNGKIEVWDWQATANDFTCIDQIYQWLQLKSHVKNHPKGKLFWVLSNEENNNFHFPKSVSSEHIIYETPEDINWDVFESKDIKTQYKVYGFSNYDEMYYLAGKYNFNQEISIAPGYIRIAGPTVLYPDTYTMICVGENLESIDVSLEYMKTIKYKGNNQLWNRLFNVDNLAVEKGLNYLVCNFSLSEIASGIRPIFTNKGDKNVKISSVWIFKNYIYYADLWNNKWLSNGYDEKGVRYLKTNAISHGPYITLVPGNYVVECDGENLDFANFDCVFNEGDGLNKIELKNIDKTNSSVRFTINTNEVINNFEVRLFNNSSKDVVIYRLTMRREK
ncbi:hypothetical protein IJG14_00155 [bacterium]|nr:hypothetical protein [bacterium]